MTFSVIIPALNEEQRIGACIRAVRAAHEHVEIIVVDGGSEDSTREMASTKGAIVRCSQRGRGIQLNCGAARASGEILLFLHADSQVSVNLFEVIRERFAHSETSLGVCRLQFDAGHWLLRLYAWCARFDSRFTTFGDQCIVVRRSFFDELGEFQDWELFEDVDFLCRARKQTRIAFLPTTIVTSARRFLENGIVRQQVRNACLLSLFFMGVSPSRLAELYAGYMHRRSDSTSRTQESALYERSTV